MCDVCVRTRRHSVVEHDCLTHHSSFHRYPDAIFELLPQLVYLDETDREGNPMPEDDDEDDDDQDDEDEYVHLCSTHTHTQHTHTVPS